MVARRDTRWLVAAATAGALLVGCSSPGSQSSSVPPATSTPTTQPTTAQPTTAQPTTTQPATTEPATTQPVTTQPATTQPATSVSNGASPIADDLFPLRLAFYYPWFPETWDSGSDAAFTNFTPTAGRYDSSDPATIRRHVDDMAYANIDVAISSWWGTGSKTSERFETLLANSRGSTLRWSLYYEPEGSLDPSSAEIVADLAPTVTAYIDDPNILRVGGRMVVFVYASPEDDCQAAQRWTGAAASLPIHVVLKVFSGFRQCSSQPGGWHQYAPAARSDPQLPWSYSVSPGFWMYDEAPRLIRDPDAFRSDVTAMIASGAMFQLITTFNEWGEGTAVEQADEWSSASGRGIYLDILHELPTRPAP